MSGASASRRFDRALKNVVTRWARVGERVSTAPMAAATVPAICIASSKAGAFSEEDRWCRVGPRAPVKMSAAAHSSHFAAREQSAAEASGW